MSKKILALCLAALLLLGLCSCDNTENLENSENLVNSENVTSYDILSAGESFDTGASKSGGDVSDAGKSEGGEDASGEASVGGERYPAVLYVANEDLTRLEEREGFFDGTIEGLIAALSEAGAFPEETKVNSFKIEGNIAYIDLNGYYGDYIRGGSFSEWFGVGSLVNTLITYYGSEGVDKVYFTVDGEIVVTGHFGTFDEPIGFMS